MKRALVYAIVVLCLFSCLFVQPIIAADFGSGGELVDISASKAASAQSKAQKEAELDELSAWLANYIAERDGTTQADADPAEGAPEKADAVPRQKSIDLLRPEIEGKLSNVVEKLASGSMTKKEIEPVLRDFYDNMDAAVLLYFLSPKGVAKAIYPDEYGAMWLGTQLRPDPSSGLTDIKIRAARNPLESKEYTCPALGVLGYDFVQPIIGNNSQYRGVLIAKFSSAGLDLAAREQTLPEQELLDRGVNDSNPADDDGSSGSGGPGDSGDSEGDLEEKKCPNGEDAAGSCIDLTCPTDSTQTGDTCLCNDETKFYDGTACKSCAASQVFNPQSVASTLGGRCEVKCEGNMVASNPFDATECICKFKEDLEQCKCEGGLPTFNGECVPKCKEGQYSDTTLHGKCRDCPNEPVQDEPKFSGEGWLDKVLDPFKNNNYSKLTLKQKKQAIRDFATFIATDLGLENSVTVVFCDDSHEEMLCEDMKNNGNAAAGQFQGTIGFLPEILDSKDPFDSMRIPGIIAHEIQHEYQEEAVRKADQETKDGIPLNLVEDQYIKNLKENMDSRIPLRDDNSGEYNAQFMEMDAIFFENEMGKRLNILNSCTFKGSK